MKVSKFALHQALVTHISAEIATMRRLALDAAEAATHEDNRPESDKDMRSTEASYIARGQAGRVLSLEQELATTLAMPLRDFAPGEGAAVSALVKVRYQGKTSVYFLVPAGGGVTLAVDGVTVQTLTPQSPLGGALLSLAEGDEAELEGPQNKPRVYEILGVF